MRNVNLRLSLWILLVLSGVVWFSFAYFAGVDLSKVSEFFGLLPKVVTVDLVAVTLFVKWVWRWKLFRGWLVPFPDLNGTWLGEIRSDWVDQNTGKRVPLIPAMLTIRQTFFHISCVMQTGEMRSDSYVEGFQINAERQVRQLAYSYGSRPRLSLQERSIPHDGTAVFEVIESDERKLRGRYWTERKTTGEMEFRFDSKTILEELPPDLTPHPMAGEEQDR